MGDDKHKKEGKRYVTQCDEKDEEVKMEEEQKERANRKKRFLERLRRRANTRGNQGDRKWRRAYQATHRQSVTLLPWRRDSSARMLRSCTEIHFTHISLLSFTSCLLIHFIIFLQEKSSVSLATLRQTLCFCWDTAPWREQANFGNVCTCLGNIELIVHT